MLVSRILFFVLPSLTRDVGELEDDRYDCRCWANRLPIRAVCGLLCAAGEAGWVSVDVGPRASAANSRSLPRAQRVYTKHCCCTASTNRHVLSVSDVTGPTKDL